MSTAHTRVNMTVIVCLGCGKDLSKESKNRCDPAAERCRDVINVLRKHFMDQVAENDIDFDLDAL